jgi:hypothetical protein
MLGEHGKGRMRNASCLKNHYNTNIYLHFVKFLRVQELFGGKLPANIKFSAEVMGLFVVLSSSSTTKVVPLPLSWGRLVLSTKLLVDILHIDEPVLAAEVVVTGTDVIESIALSKDGLCLGNFVTVNQALLAVKGVCGVS